MSAPPLGQERQRADKSVCPTYGRALGPQADRNVRPTQLAEDVFEALQQAGLGGGAVFGREGLGQALD